ncbi:MAG: PBP1A family penicillin-binding protein [Syntrophomonadaceae bacterium]|nr:PBP1A family penicillin-binding protein [Syntrophomonadaceae bacterium]
MKPLIKIGTLLIGIIMFALCFFIGLSVAKSTMSVTQFITGINKWEYHIKEQTTIYYSDNTEMAKIGYKKECSDDFPDLMKKAVVATEDRRFYEHNGLDSRGIGRAIWNNLKRGRKSEGGSTITQQLARTLFLSQEKTYSRKIKEVFIATAIEDKYSKDEILNMYLNEIYMGRGCSGMQCAANSYFGKNVMDLNEAEITALVGMIQAPEYYKPEDNMEALKKRQAIVVNNLVTQGFITEEEGETILNKELNFKPYKPSSNNKHPYYLNYLTAKLEEVVGVHKLYQGGLKIYTTIDPRMQSAAERALQKNVQGFAYRGIGAKDAALVSIDPETGAIKAMVGGYDYQKNQLNMAVIARQPGSVIKPLYYAAAINEGIIKEDTVVNNKERSFNGYNPKNYGSNSPDSATVKEALVYSHNVASVEVLEKLGISKAIKYLERYGITSLTEEDENLALALGGMSRGISPLQMAAAYAIFPSQGIYKEHYTIQKIVDEQDKTIYNARLKEKRVLKSSTAIVMDDILKGVINYGTGTSTKVSIASAGKTGTTTDSKDLWFVGYTKELVTAVWVGNSDGKPVTGYRTYGGTVAGPIWRDYMNTLIYNRVLREAPLPAPKTEVEEPEEPLEEDEELDEEEELIEEEVDEPTEGEENNAGEEIEIDEGNNIETNPEELPDELLEETPTPILPEPINLPETLPEGLQ